MEKAEKIEDIIALENQLSETIAEKESLKTSLINIDDKVDFSTINIEIQEVEKLSNAETIETTFGTRIKKMPLVIPYLDLKKIHGEFCYFINISTSIYLGFRCSCVFSIYDYKKKLNIGNKKKLISFF